MSVYCCGLKPGIFSGKKDRECTLLLAEFPEERKLWANPSKVRLYKRLQYPVVPKPLDPKEIKKAQDGGSVVLFGQGNSTFGGFSVYDMGECPGNPLPKWLREVSCREVMEKPAPEWMRGPVWHGPFMHTIVAESQSYAQARKEKFLRAIGATRLCTIRRSPGLNHGYSIRVYVGAVA